LYSTDSSLLQSISIFLVDAGQLPENWTIETLLEKHSSTPYNPDIANAFLEVVTLNRGDEELRK